MLTSLLITASPVAIAETELETLRSRCSEQERQIRHLEEEISKLRSANEGERTTPSPQPKASPAPAQASSTPTSSTYVVKPGDNLVKIARSVGTSSDKLAKANGLKPSSIIRPGQKLKVPGKAAPASASATAQATAPNEPAAKPQASSTRTHKIKANETYSSISRKYKIPTETLIAANPKIKPTALREGQVINLERPSAPVRKEANTAQAVPPPSAPAPTPAPSPPVQAEKSSLEAPAPPKEVADTPPPHPSAPKKLLPILIDKEMTYGDFAAKHGTDVQRLNALNGLDLTETTLLAKGSELYVPGK